MTWNINKLTEIKVKNPILIEGLPGVGNVGKVAIDYLIDSLDAKKLFEITSDELPHCVFVNEENLVELPTISIYYKQLKNNTLLFLAGDIQPLNEKSCYSFCHTILDNFKKEKLNEIITLGGIATSKIPKNPRVFCTANSKKILQKYGAFASPNIHGIVGPIIGVSGLLPGLAGKRSIPAVALLAETFAHPNYIGIKGAKELLEVIKKQLKLKVDLSELEDDATELEKEIKKSNEIHKALAKEDAQSEERTDYIG